MKAFSVIFRLMIVFSLLITAACSKPKIEPVETPPDVKILAADLRANLSQIDTTMAGRIAAFKGSFGNETEIRILLTETLNAHPAILSSCYIDPKGILKYLEPAKFKDSEGADISQQAHTIAIMKDPKPLLSAPFKAVEGFATVVIAHPLFDANKRFMGSLNLTLDTSALPQLVLNKNKVPSNYELWAMETDGITVCDQDKAEIGLNIFTDPVYQPYESLRILAKTIAAQTSGEGQYSFKAAGSETVAQKHATWDTIELHGKIWRVVLVSK
ncbi:MAG TPA: hypothetical protein P5533_07765 [Candidatus Cloacimonadota bacterium]|nr:hypothetical protein [Candidatus Cloacimonadota bacterium]